MFRRTLLPCLFLTVALAGCAAPQRTARPEAVACDDEGQSGERSCWLPFSGPDGQYGALMCACYALILTAAAVGVWVLVADAANWRDHFP